jgi:hypothetical protein
MRPFEFLSAGRKNHSNLGRRGLFSWKKKKNGQRWNCLILSLRVTTELQMSLECNELISVMLVYLYTCCQSKGLIQKLMIWESIGYSSGLSPIILHMNTQMNSPTVQYIASWMIYWPANAYKGTVKLTVSSEGKVQLLNFSHL